MLCYNTSSAVFNNNTEENFVSKSKVLSDSDRYKKKYTVIVVIMLWKVL